MIPGTENTSVPCGRLVREHVWCIYSGWGGPGGEGAVGCWLNHGHSKGTSE